MQKLHFTITIDAPKEKVWETMLGDKTYPEWTAAFMPGSSFVGKWEKGSKIQFIAPDENGKNSGMTSEIADLRLHEFVSIKHLGLIENGVEDTTSEKAKSWVGFENYTFKEDSGKTTLEVDIDIQEDFADEMTKGWNKSLQKLKELSE